MPQKENDMSTPAINEDFEVKNVALFGTASVRADEILNEGFVIMNLFVDNGPGEKDASWLIHYEHAAELGEALLKAAKEASQQAGADSWREPIGDE
jgi:hypothetical protein